MSENEKDTEQKTEVTETEVKASKEKYVTKYDRKMQQREEQKKKEKKEEAVSKLVSVLVVLAVLCLVVYFPIRNYMAVHETYVKVNGENVSRVEFDYNYNAALNNYVNQYGSYLSYFGLDLSQDLSSQMYSDDLSWKDYFEQMAIESITTEKALMSEAKANGFSYDTAEEYTAYEDGVKQAAEAANISVKQYVQQNYGEYATLGRIKGFIQNGIFTKAYYNHVSDEKAATDDEILAYYNENTSDYDSVDYYLTTVNAELPTEPTDLADPVEETESAEAVTDEEATYQPSEAEIEKAMADAKEIADAALENVTTDGELQENILKADAVYSIRDWLYDESRKEGDSTVIENEAGYCYYVVSFVKRYRDDTPSADIRIIGVGDNDGQAILDEWKNGEATEESFAALADKYNDTANFSAKGGLFEAVTPDGSPDELADWIFAAGRSAGDTEFITAENYSYVVYYVGTNKAKWQLDIGDSLLAETMEQYLKEIAEPVTVEDVKGNLKYLQVNTEDEAAADETASEVIDLTEGAADDVTAETVEEVEETVEEAAEEAVEEATEATE